MRTILFTSLIAIAGCATNAGDEQLDDAADGKADAASRPSGSYQNLSPSVGELSTLALNADHTFVRTELVECAQGVFGCPPIEQRGTYKLTRSSTKHFIRFYADDGSDLDRYQWKIVRPIEEAAHLELEADGNDYWFKMYKVDAVEHCGGFAGQLCGAGEYCEYSAGSCGAADQSGICKPTPASCPRIIEPVCGCDGRTYDNECFANRAGFSVSHDGVCENACQAAGGSCVPLVPDACAVGTIGDAQEYSCGGALGVECCLPIAQ